MNNFIFSNPTKIIFGKGEIVSLSKELDKSDRILLLYGGGSIKQNGVYDQVKSVLNGFDVVEFGGIEPNPQLQTCIKAVQFARENKVSFILAVGGGSVADAAKFIAQIFYLPDQETDVYDRKIYPDKALPLACVITLPATGSEMNMGCVISRASTNDKRGFHNPLVYPRFSIIDPSVTFTLPARQIANGIIDSFVHTIEQYATYDVNTPLQDFWAIGVMKTLLLEGKKTLDEPTNYEARANLCWASTCALNGFIRVGIVEDWAVHMIGHELTALYGIDHAVSLAVVLPARYEYSFLSKKHKLAKLGVELFSLSGSEDEVAKQSIVKIDEFFRSLGVKTRLSELGINAQEAANKISQRFLESKVSFGENNEIDAKAAYEIVLKS